MKPDKTTLIVPLLLIGVGAGWLLTVLGIVPGINWIWTLGLTSIGFLTFAVGGFDKVTFVIGSFFISAGSLSVLRQAGRLSLDVEIPILVMLSGVLLLIARSSTIASPSWTKPPVEERAKRDSLKVQ